MEKSRDLFFRSLPAINSPRLAKVFGSTIHSAPEVALRRLRLARPYPRLEPHNVSRFYCAAKMVTERGTREQPVSPATVAIVCRDYPVDEPITGYESLARPEVRVHPSLT